MFEVGDYWRPCLFVIFKLLQEATDADYHMLALYCTAATSIEPEHLAPLYRIFYLESFQELLTKEFMH